MLKVLTLSGMIVALLILILFGLDLAVGIPFSKASTIMDICFIIAAVMLGFMSWTTFKEQR